MEIQIFGTLKCNDTKKALRFFKDRRIKVHFVDLNEKKLSKGELNNISRSVAIEDLLDRGSKQFKKRNLDHFVFDIQEELLEDPLLLHTPITRFKQKSTLGFAQYSWKQWIKSEKE